MANIVLDCPFCGGKAHLASAKKVYGEKSDYGFVYLCENYPTCDAYVGVHKNGEPKGTLADKDLRALRKKCHEKFDPFWQDGLISRNEMYKWLQDVMYLTPDEAHIGMFDTASCTHFLQLLDSFTDLQEKTKRGNVNAISFDINRDMIPVFEDARRRLAQGDYFTEHFEVEILSTAPGANYDHEIYRVNLRGASPQSYMLIGALMQAHDNRIARVSKIYDHDFAAQRYNPGIPGMNSVNSITGNTFAPNNISDEPRYHSPKLRNATLEDKLRQAHEQLIEDAKQSQVSLTAEQIRSFLKGDTK